jgi:hypothetical protein
MRYFRFNLDTAAEYEDMRSAVDGLLGYSPGTTCIQPYSSAPADQKGRVVLPLLDFTPGYEDLVLRALLLVAGGKAKELTQDEYDASFFPAPSGGGGGVSSFNDLTDKPTTRAGYGITDAQKTITSGSAAPTGGSSGDYYIQTSAAGQVTPATLTTSTNDYAPGNGDIYRLSASAAVNLTGWTAWTDGTLKMLVNVGSFVITLKHQNTSSSASNRFITPTAGDYALSPGSSMVMYWDATDSRVRVF